MTTLSFSINEQVLFEYKISVEWRVSIGRSDP